MTTQYTEAEAEALEALQDLALSFEKRGWKAAENGLAAGFAWARLTREGHLDAQAFFAVDPDTHEDRYLYGPHTVTEDMLPAIAEAASRTEVELLLGMDAHVKEKRKRAPSVPPTVPPTSAAHTDTGTPVPPTSAAHVPPTEDTDSHTVEGAAHTDAEPMPPTDAAHPRRGDLITRPMPPIPEKTGLEGHFEEYGEIAAHQSDFVPPIDNEAGPDSERWIAHASKAHIAEVEASGSDAYNQSDVYDAVAVMETTRMWSPFASEMTNEALLKKARGNDVVWRNRISGRLDQARISKDGGKHPASITPADWVPTPVVQEDPRILHFLEQGGGFRSVAVASIKTIR